jgi:hypothetical protein
VSALRSRTLQTVLAAAVPVGLVLSAAVVWQSTSAAFSATTENPGNSWRTGTVVLSDSDTGAALFNSTDDGVLRPGSTRARCIRVDYTGDLPSDIRLYVTTPSSGSASLDPYLLMSVERGQDVAAGTDVTPDCTAGFTSAAPATFLWNTHSANDGLADQTKTLSQLKTRSTYATGLPVATGVTQGTHLTFRITYLVKDDNAAQNTQSDASFVWEARNT